MAETKPSESLHRHDPGDAAETNGNIFLFRFPQ